MRKKFDKELYALNDKLAKDAAMLVLSGAGYTQVRESPRKTDVDLQVLDKDGNIMFYVEVERKAVWTTPEFPYTNVQFPERKTKYANLDKPTYYLMFSGDMKKYLVVKGQDLLTSPIEMVRNKYVAYGEMFYQVPLDRVTFNNFKE
jgi:hypothetical protein